MGSIKNPPKYYNPNWSKFSARKKRWEYANKKIQLLYLKKSMNH